MSLLPLSTPVPVLVAQLNELAQRERVSVIVAFPALLTVAWVHIGVVPVPRAIGWLAALSILLLIRLALSSRPLEIDADPLRIRHLLSLRVLLSILYGTGWGLAMILFDTGQADFLFMFKIATMAAVLSLTLTALSVVLPVYIGFAAPLALCMLAHLLTATFLQPNEQLALFIGIVVFCVLLIITAFGVARLTRTALEQGQERETALNAAQISHLREMELRERLQEESTLLAQTNQSLHAANERLSVLARQDALTGAFNRRHLMDELERQLHTRDRYGTAFSIIILDVDRFKSINDTHGHQVGDLVLIGLTRLLRENLRDIDVCGRWGGEEFLCILPNTPIPEAIYCADRLRRGLETARLVEALPALAVTASFGVGTCQDGETIDALLQRVDALLYAAKTAGRNRVMN